MGGIYQIFDNIPTPKLIWTPLLFFHFLIWTRYFYVEKILAEALMFFCARYHYFSRFDNDIREYGDFIPSSICRAKLATPRVVRPFSIYFIEKGPTPRLFDIDKYFFSTRGVWEMNSLHLPIHNKLRWLSHLACRQDDVARFLTQIHAVARKYVYKIILFNYIIKKLATYVIK